MPFFICSCGNDNVNDKEKKMKIDISEIQILPVKPHNGLLAFCSFVINNSFYVGDIAIYSRLDGSGYRLVYPAKVLSNGVKINCFHPINSDASSVIENQVTNTFLALVEKVKKRNQESAERTNTNRWKETI